MKDVLQQSDRIFASDSLANAAGGFKHVLHLPDTRHSVLPVMVKDMQYIVVIDVQFFCNGIRHFFNDVVEHGSPYGK